MGDKSPKSKQKDKNQKQSKAAATEKKKRRGMDSKHQANFDASMKKQK